MRHRVATKSLGRRSEHRNSMLQNLAAELLKKERITTTQAKAKVACSVTEEIITKAKRGTLHDRRLVLAKLTDEDAVRKAFDELATRYADRPGGYTRMYKLMPRKGDAAAMAMLELV